MSSFLCKPKYIYFVPNSRRVRHENLDFKVWDVFPKILDRVIDVAKKFKVFFDKQVFLWRSLVVLPFFTLHLVGCIFVPNPIKRNFPLECSRTFLFFLHKRLVSQKLDQFFFIQTFTDSQKKVLQIRFFICGKIST